MNLVLDGASWIADAEAQHIIAFASIAMLLTVRPSLAAKTGTMQVAEIELAVRMSVLALPVLNLHMLGRWPDAGLAIATEAPLFSNKRNSKSFFVSVVVIIGMLLLLLLYTMPRECRGLWTLLDGAHSVDALQKANQRTGAG
jgi:hypothetical protein